MYNVGMYGGCFDLIHIGHLNNFIQAASLCKKLYIILSYSKERDFIPVDERYKWIYNMTKQMKNVIILKIEDNAKSKDDYTDEYWENGALEIKSLINEPIDVVFCGSDYLNANKFEKLYHESKIYYFDRSIISISSSEIKKDIFKYWNFIPNICKPYFIKKVLIIGGESTGKSVLTENLSLFFNTNFVKEVGRDVCERCGGEAYMTNTDFEEILIKHKNLELEKIKESNKLLFIDTDCLITNFFSNFLIVDNKEKEKINNLSNSISDINNFDLVLFLEPDVEWEVDPLRSDEIRDNREKYSKEIEDLFIQKNISFEKINGSYLERFEKSKKLILDKFFKGGLNFQ